MIVFFVPVYERNGLRMEWDAGALVFGWIATRARCLRMVDYMCWLGGYITYPLD